MSGGAGGKSSRRLAQCGCADKLSRGTASIQELEISLPGIPGQGTERQ